MNLFGLTALEGEPLIVVGAMASNDRRKQLRGHIRLHIQDTECSSESPHPSDILSPAKLHITKRPYLLPHGATNWGSSVHTHKQ